MTQAQALTQALVLAITAPSDEQANKAISLSMALANQLTNEVVEQCKAEALDILGMEDEA